MDYKISFKDIPWEHPSTGVKQKTIIQGNRRLRLLQFDDQFVEKEWCIKGHCGYVVEGAMKISFDGESKSYIKGDGLWIPSGQDYRHKASIAKGQTVLLVLFEDLD